MNSLMKLKFVGCPKSFSRLRMFSSEIKRLEGSVSMVQGASTGIGLEFVKQLLEKTKEGHVVATCSNPSVATGLLELKNKFADRLDIHRLHLTNYSTIEETAKAVEDKYGCLNLLINAFSLISIPRGGHTDKALDIINKASLLRFYEVNAIGPIMVLKGMLPLLKAGGTDSEIAVVANISHTAASIGATDLRCWHSYQSSQDTLHQLTGGVLMELQQSKEDGIKCIVLHPGVIHIAGVSPARVRRHLPKEYSARMLLSYINEVKTSELRPVYSDNLRRYFYFV
ncbi:hypothetical protein ACS0TY_000499 [Phlomoides rotata]